MKKFVFRFEKILQLRIDKESEVRNKLGKVNKIILDKETELQGVVSSYENFLQDLNEAFKEGVYVRDMQAVSSNKSYLTNKIEHLKHELSVLVEERRTIQTELIEANKQRKIMEKLKEKELANYKELEALEEAKTVDQIVTYQSTKSRGEK